MAFLLVPEDRVINMLLLFTVVKDQNIDNANPNTTRTRMDVVVLLLLLMVVVVVVVKSLRMPKAAAAMVV